MPCIPPLPVMHFEDILSFLYAYRTIGLLIRAATLFLYMPSAFVRMTIRIIWTVNASDLPKDEKSDLVKHL